MTGNQEIASIRRFNRFYTNHLGLLDRYLRSEFSLPEVRVLYEIETETKCMAKKLSERLCIDAGYLSRILKRLEKRGLVEKKTSPEDGRSRFLHLTQRGKKALAELNRHSDTQIGALIEPLSEVERSGLVRNMSAIEGALAGKKRPDPAEITIRHKLRPGDIGWLIHMHGWIYERECGYPLAFEGYVAETFYKFMKTYDAVKDRIWLAEHNGETVGAIGIAGQPGKAQLRWFLLHPDYRGLGIGKRLLGEALKFCRRKKYPKVFLLTTEDQEQAIAMYVKTGFVKVAERESHLWVDNLVEYTFEMSLAK